MLACFTMYIEHGYLKNISEKVANYGRLCIIYYCLLIKKRTWFYVNTSR